MIQRRCGHNLPIRKLLLAIVLGWAAAVWAATPLPLTTVKAIHNLTDAEARQGLPVAFEATVTYFRQYQKNLYVQDDGAATFVKATTDLKLVPGDRVLVRGTTRSTFHTNVISNHIALLHHGALPKAVPATFDELIRAQHNAMLVSVRGHIHSADLVASPISPMRFTALRMLTDGGYVDVEVDSDDANALKGLLDTEAEVTGVAGARFDGKMEQTGVVLHVSNLADIKILKRAGVNPWSLPVTPMDQILTKYYVKNLTQRIRVSGTITYYEPGSVVVLQNGARSLWIKTQSIAPLRIGDMADATGFPNVNEGFLTLTGSEIQDHQVQAPIEPQPVVWHQLASSGHVFDLVSIEGQVVMEVREASQDEYVLVSDGYLFSAIYRHIDPTGAVPRTPMKHIPVGSKVRVSGICVLDSANPFDRNVSFNILLRSADDIAVVARPSWVTIGNLIRLVSILLVVAIASFVWAGTLKRKVLRQTADLSARIEAEAAFERRMALLEHRRSHILEDINKSRPLAEIMEEITEMVSFQMDGAPSWCQIAGGALLGNYSAGADQLRIVSKEIAARSGPPLGVLFAGLDPLTPPADGELEALSTGTKLAAVAIETRRLYSDLVYRSEFDTLTDIQNRFSFEKRLDALIPVARETASTFGLIYIDLDKFKLVNDIYGHQAGDLYLQEAAARMKQQLRPGDLLARLGGDEFAVLVPRVRNRSGVEEIALRLERCFVDAFTVDGLSLHGSASVGLALYPQDGVTRDSLLSAADAAMYVAKHNSQDVEPAPAEPAAPQSPPVDPGHD